MINWYKLSLRERRKEKRPEPCRSSIYTFLPFNACRSWHSSRTELINFYSGVYVRYMYIYLEPIQTIVVIVCIPGHFLVMENLSFPSVNISSSDMSRQPVASFFKQNKVAIMLSLAMISYTDLVIISKCCGILTPIRST